MNAGHWQTEGGRFCHTNGTVLYYIRRACQFESTKFAGRRLEGATASSVGDLHPQQGVEYSAPFQVAVVACLELLADADQSLLECILAARVQHLLLDGRVLRAPGHASISGLGIFILASGRQPSSREKMHRITEVLKICPLSRKIHRVGKICRNFPVYIAFTSKLVGVEFNTPLRGGLHSQSLNW